jgi:hypothetical protein
MGESTILLAEHLLDRAERHARYYEWQMARVELEEARLVLKHVPITRPERHALVERYFRLDSYISDPKNR